MWRDKSWVTTLTGFLQSGRGWGWVCDFLPHAAAIVDDLCLVKSMHTGAMNHEPSISFFLPGAERPGRPSMGAWATYGLGTESEVSAAVCFLLSDAAAYITGTELRIACGLPPGNRSTDLPATAHDHHIHAPTPARPPTRRPGEYPHLGQQPHAPPHTPGVP